MAKVKIWYPDPLIHDDSAAEYGMERDGDGWSEILVCESESEAFQAAAAERRSQNRAGNYNVIVQVIS